MTLASLKDTYPDYQSTFSDSQIGHIDDYSLYADDDNKVGSVEDGLFDETTGQFRYLVVDTGGWIFGKKVLLPIGRVRFDNKKRHVYATGLTKNQVENLPKYDGVRTVDYDHEERVRGIYRENAAGQSAPVSGTAYTQESYTYDSDPELYTMADREERNQPIRLYEERLVADKKRVKTGSVSVGKRIETETKSVSVPVEKERVVIERSAPSGTGAVTTDHAFNEGEVARVEVHEERAVVGKEAVLREEVTVRKETEQETYTEQATVRREELDVDTDGDTNVVNQ